MAPHTTTTGVISLLMLLAMTPLTQSQTLPAPFTSAPLPLETNDTTTLNETSPTPRSGPIDQPPEGLRIVDDDAVYKYVGCWSETTAIPPNSRALDGPYMTVPGLMQVKPCLEYCGFATNRFHPERKGYQYAGLEFSRECWCGDNLSIHSYHLMDYACDTACDGDNTTVCGGHLALTLYNATHPKHGDGDGRPGDGEGDAPGGNQPPSDEAVAQAVGVGLLVLAVTFAFGFGFL
ncbi:hypothetical protein F4804DRAFT_333408 [Jackrogersella minutella]|nr:hypothetical protein F4804DRAFT_333408 [Jackrogersella minutella]